jgi:hypothetical protein
MLKQIKALRLVLVMAFMLFCFPVNAYEDGITYLYTQKCSSNLSVSSLYATCKSSLTGYVGSTTKIEVTQTLQVKNGAQCSTTNVGTNVNATYSFNVDGNYDIPNTFTNYCGQKGNKGIILNTAGSYTITATCNSYASIRLEIYIANTDGSLGYKTASVTIPKEAPGLSSITTHVNLPSGKFYVKFVSNTYSLTKRSGYSTIKNVYGIF